MNDVEAVELTVIDRVARIRLNRPAQRNALNLAMCLALRQHIETVEANPEIRVVILDGAGKIFCAGADLKERKDKDIDWVRRRRLAAFAAYNAIEHCSKPVVALLHADVVGSGGEMALACDFIVASDDAVFRFPEPQWGTVGATQRLQRAIGRQRAKDLLFTGRDMHSEEALECGLVARVVARVDLTPTGQAIAEKITSAPALAMRLTKQAMDLGFRTDLDSAIRIELAAFDQVLLGTEWSSGVARFLTKEKPSA